MGEEKQKLLADNEPLWIMTTEAGISKETLERGLNRTSVLISSVSDLIKYSTEIRTNKGESSIAKANMVFDNTNLPAEIKGSLDTIKVFIDTLQEIKVFEVGVKPNDLQIFNSTKGRFGSLSDFIRFAQTAVRENQIDELDPLRNETQLIKSLQTDLYASTQKIELIQKELDTAKELQEKAELDMTTLQNSVEIEYIPKLKLNEELIEELEYKIKSLEREKKSQQNKIKTYMLEKDKILSENIDLVDLTEAKDGIISDKDEIIRNLKYNIQELEQKLSDSNENITEILTSRVDAVDLIRQQEKNAELLVLLEKEKDKLKQVSLELRKTKLYNENLEGDIAEISVSNSNLNKTGRATYISNINLNRASLFYIKLFDPLPYHRKAIQKLYDKILERHSFRKGILIVLKHEESLDDNIYNYSSIVNTLEGIHYEDDMVRLIPNHNMSQGIEEFENNYDFVMVVDYIRDENYYVSTEGKSIINTFVQHSKYIDFYNLKGLPVSYDVDSIYNIQYDSQLQGKDRLLSDKILSHRVDNWYKNLLQSGMNI